ncbi:enoyl-CoA hydratase/isomerase family protein [Novosphingobium sp. G106]|uniref:enoyl-CoA hydratase/isomerase family protein n=1 Tax=Novosphingobium sp. G106 TaxID=2849500 RepID=UPI001C2D89AC|nr:enoyl-CoA hydratase/isomerase family protein [Novosphingobium sp. G106]MBV1687973.1 enoyl-CoA hydratase/isomerase family protein [Novosphingobium sp. G106]
MSEARITREDADGLCTLTLNRPDKLNALDTAAFEALDAHCAALEQATETIGCVVLRGSGRGFSAGADLGKIGATPIDPRFKPGVIDRLSRLPQPVIAAVHGVCFTGGLELALACDFIVADATAKFADTHGKFGLVGAWGMGQRLSRRIGTPAAKHMMMTARALQANEARDIGLVDMLVEAGGLDAVIASLSAEILANSRHTNFAAKRMLRETEGMSLADALAHEHENYPGSAPDSPERIARFTRK